MFLIENLALDCVASDDDAGGGGGWLVGGLGSDGSLHFMLLVIVIK